MDILAPVIYGIVIAYLLTPLCNILYRFCLSFFPRRVKSKKAVQTLSNGISVGLSLAFGILILVGLLWLVIPQLIESIRSVAESSQALYDSASTWLQKFFADNQELSRIVMSAYESAGSKLQGWLQNTVLPKLDSILLSVSGGIVTVVLFLKNMLIGLIIAVYLLYSRKLFVAQLKKIVYAILPLKPANIAMEEFQYAHKMFTSFITGNLVDSFIIGLITFAACNILDFPFVMLITVIVGVTNIIPFFGPFIGAIPSAVLILLVDPIKCIVFLIYILLVQQFDGNILKPKILGQSTGLSSFWVLFSLLLFGGMFGFVGMLIGVPVFAVIYDIIGRLLRYLLQKRALPMESESYDGVAYIDINQSVDEEEPSELSVSAEENAE